MRGLPPRTTWPGCGTTATVIWWSAANAPAASTPSGPLAIETRSHHKVHLHKVVDEDQRRGAAVLLFRGARQEGGRASPDASPQRFESELQKLHEGLSRPRTRKGFDSCLAAHRAHPGALPRRRAALPPWTSSTDPHSGKAVAVTWESQAPCPGTMLTHPGVYCLRSNVQ